MLGVLKKFRDKLVDMFNANQFARKTWGDNPIVSLRILQKNFIKKKTQLMKQNSINQSFTG